MFVHVVGGVQATVVENIKQYCEYVKSGEHHGKYILKQYLRAGKSTGGAGGAGDAPM